MGEQQYAFKSPPVLFSTAKLRHCLGEISRASLIAVTRRFLAGVDHVLDFGGTDILTERAEQRADGENAAGLARKIF